jgi:hypothetical protein
MKITTLIPVLLLLGMGTNLNAQDSIVDTVAKGCEKEIESYCSQVSPGEGRMLACFYAHEDKLTGQCQYALYQAANTLDQAVSALQYVASECENDIMQNCADVQMGEGRIIECLRGNPDTVSESCKQALNDVFE